MKKLISSTALTTSLSLYAANNGALGLPTLLLFLICMKKPTVPLTEKTLRALIKQEQAEKRAQRQESQARQDAKPSNNNRKKQTTRKKI